MTSTEEIYLWLVLLILMPWVVVAACSSSYRSFWRLLAVVLLLQALLLPQAIALPLKFDNAAGILGISVSVVILVPFLLLGRRHVCEIRGDGRNAGVGNDTAPPHLELPFATSFDGKSLGVFSVAELRVFCLTWTGFWAFILLLYVSLATVFIYVLFPFLPLLVSTLSLSILRLRRVESRTWRVLLFWYPFGFGLVSLVSFLMGNYFSSCVIGVLVSVLSSVVATFVSSDDESSSSASRRYSGQRRRVARRCSLWGVASVIAFFLWTLAFGVNPDFFGVHNEAHVASTFSRAVPLLSLSVCFFSLDALAVKMLKDCPSNSGWTKCVRLLCALVLLGTLMAFVYWATNYIGNFGGSRASMVFPNAKILYSLGFALTLLLGGIVLLRLSQRRWW